MHDARVFTNSTLYRKGQEGDLLPQWVEHLGDIPLVILGDPTYPLLSRLMKAVPDNDGSLLNINCLTIDLAGPEW